MRNIILIFFSIFLSSCNGQKKMINNEIDGGNNKLSLLMKDNYSNINIPEIQIIKEPKSLKSFFSKINKSRKPGLAVPRIDFNKNMVIVLCSGEQKDGTITMLTFNKEEEIKIILNVAKENVTDKNVSATLTTPFYLYKMPLTDKNIVFNKKE